MPQGVRQGRDPTPAPPLQGAGSENTKFLINFENNFD